MEINAAEFRANCFKILDQVKITIKRLLSQNEASRLQDWFTLRGRTKKILSLEAWKGLSKLSAI